MWNIKYLKLFIKELDMYWPCLDCSVWKSKLLTYLLNVTPLFKKQNTTLKEIFYLYIQYILQIIFEHWF